MKLGKAIGVAGSVIWIGILIIGLPLAYGIEAGELLKATPGQFDAGTVAEGETIVTTASIQNMGSTPVEITNVRTS